MGGSPVEAFSTFILRIFHFSIHTNITFRFNRITNPPKLRWQGGSHDRAATGIEPAACRSQDERPAPQTTRISGHHNESNEGHYTSGPSNGLPVPLITTRFLPAPSSFFASLALLLIYARCSAAALLSRSVLSRSPSVFFSITPALLVSR